MEDDVTPDEFESAYFDLLRMMGEDIESGAEAMKQLGVAADEAAESLKAIAAPLSTLDWSEVNGA